MVATMRRLWVLGYMVSVHGVVFRCISYASEREWCLRFAGMTNRLTEGNGHLWYVCFPIKMKLLKI